MSQRLTYTIRQYLTRKGNAGMATLCVEMDRTSQTILRWLRVGFPSAHDAYKLAVAAGCTEEEALDLANECFPQEAKRTA